MMQFYKCQAQLQGGAIFALGGVEQLTRSSQ